MTHSNRCVLSLVPVAVLALTAQPVASAVITADGVCSLVAALEAANEDLPRGACPAGSGADTIVLTAHVLLTEVENEADGPNGLPSVYTRITIEGGWHQIVRDPDGEAFRILHVAEDGELTLNDTIVRGGRVDLPGASGGGILSRGVLNVHHSVVGENAVVARSTFIGTARGGGIAVYGGVARIIESAVVENVAHSLGPSALGGGVYASFSSQGSLQVIDSLFLRNEAVSAEVRNDGGGVFAAAASDVFGSTTARIVGSAFVDNVAERGGAVFSQVPLQIVNSTFSSNEATEGGALSGIANVRQSTFAGNTGGGEAILGVDTIEQGGPRGITVSGCLFAASDGDHCAGNVVDAGGGNLADDASCVSTIAGTLTGLDPVLADNGGPTPTHALDADSNAIDIAGDCGLSTDQRGAARVGLCDSGAYEEIGCGILEFKDETITSVVDDYTCSTALLGPDLIIDSPSFTIHVGELITIKNGFDVRAGSELMLGFWPH